jgi:hypothetical protein
MPAFSEFLDSLLQDGKIAFRSAKPPQDRPSERDLAILAEAYAAFALSVAGPPIAFDARVAGAAAELVRQASWALVSREEGVDDLKRRLCMPTTPGTPAHHLSADLMLRYLPQVLRRVRGLDATDPLIGILADVLRGWPLSGVLSDVEEGPLVAIDFGRHPGLLMLYGERLAANDRPAWRPEPSSRAYEYYRLASGGDLV